METNRSRSAKALFCYRRTNTSDTACIYCEHASVLSRRSTFCMRHRMPVGIHRTCDSAALAQCLQ